MDKDKFIQELLLRIDVLTQEVKKLNDRLAKYEHPKNSNNSSIPPSRDENRPKRTSSLRVKTGKKPGGQLGHKGKTLKMTNIPDEIIELKSDYCQCCGEALSGMPTTKEEARQILDIPPIKAVYKEFRTFSTICKCGHKSTPEFPQGVSTPVSYGQHIEGLIGYFHTRQYVNIQDKEPLLFTRSIPAKIEKIN